MLTRDVDMFKDIKDADMYILYSADDGTHCPLSRVLIHTVSHKMENTEH